MKQKVEDILAFTDFINEFRKVERLIKMVGDDRHENDAEHSYQLGILAWYIINDLKLDLNIEKVFKFCLAHDLVEIYASDTPFWGTKELETKEVREKEALEKIKEQFKDKFPEMIENIEFYEENKTTDSEASFVYALDKLLPMLNIYLDNGRSWKEKYPKLDAETAIKAKTEKISYSKEISAIFEEFAKKLRERGDELFGS
jgi:putative hydrolase of HD superfamily